MRPLPELSVEMKAFTTAMLLFAGLAMCMGLLYLDVSHRTFGGSYMIGPADIAATYYGPGVDVMTLISLAHIHMMGLLAVFWIIGFVFIHSSFPAGWRAFWAVLPFGAFIVDVCGWFLTKLTPGFVYVVLIGGGLFVLALVVMILLSLYDMWITPLRRVQG